MRPAFGAKDRHANLSIPRTLSFVALETGLLFFFSTYFTVCYDSTFSSGAIACDELAEDVKGLSVAEESRQ